MWPEVEQTKNEHKRELKLSGCAISERIDLNGLDRSIFDIDILNLLNISDTSLKIVPSEIANLNNLQTLLLYGNEINSLPSSIGQLDKLKVLDISRNKLRQIPEEVANLTNLATINLSNNELTDFPSLQNLPKLSMIDLSINKLTKFPDICYENNGNLSEINFKENIIDEIPGQVVQLSGLKHLCLASNQIKCVPKILVNLNKLKDLDLANNPIADKRLLKLIQQCHTKQILDYVRQHGVETRNDSNNSAGDQKSSGKSKKSKKNQQLEQIQNKLIVSRHTDSSLKVIYDDVVKEIRPFIICCIVKDLNLNSGNFKKFLQLQTKLHDSVCGKREKSTIATHDLQKLLTAGSFVQYTAKIPSNLEIFPLGKMKKVTAKKLYEYLKAEAEAVRKEKKRNVYSGIHKYLYLLENKTQFACLEDATGNCVSLPPLTNGDLTKITPETTEILIEITSSSSMTDCRGTMEELLKEMLSAGYGNVAEKADAEESSSFKQLNLQQVKITDADGNLRTVFPSKTDLNYDESTNILIERD